MRFDSWLGRRLTAGLMVASGLGLANVPGLLRAEDAAKPRPAPAAVAPAADVAPAVAPVPAEKPLVQIAILLDTSGSMDGLINQARSQIWRIVNDFAKAKRAGVAPRLEVGLYTYGRDDLPADQHHLKMLLPLSTDLDKVSEELFKLNTNGGEEYCGAAIQHAVDHLKWSTRKGDLKVLFIAGNEAFNQGPVDYRAACKAAISKGIMVNTIHCGSDSDGQAGFWKAGADLADGRYLTIDQEKREVAIAAPQDDEIAQLGGKLNDTYLGFGAAGKEGKLRQAEQDKAAGAAAPGAAQARQLAKSGENYDASAWDLLDAIKNKKVALKDVKDADLPEEIKKLKPEEREAFIDAKLKQRAEIAEKIRKLSEEREKYVAEERKRQAAAKAGDSLDEAVIKAVREQAVKNGFKYE